MNNKNKELVEIILRDIFSYSSLRLLAVPTANDSPTVSV